MDIIIDAYVGWPMSLAFLDLYGLAHIDLGIDYVILALGLITHSTTVSIVWWS